MQDSTITGASYKGVPTYEFKISIAYGKRNQKQFLIDGSESPKSIPSWVWAGLIVFFGWAVFYVLTS